MTFQARRNWTQKGWPYCWGKLYFRLAFSLFAKICFTDFQFNLHEFLNRANFLFPKFWGRVIQVGFKKNVTKLIGAQSLPNTQCLNCSSNIKWYGKRKVISDRKNILEWFSKKLTAAGCKESRVRQPGASGFCDRASEFCA